MRLLFSILTIVFFLDVCVATSSKVDSLLARVHSRPDDTIKVYDLVRLYQEVNYSDHKMAKIYCDEAYRLSQKLDFKRGVAVSLKHYGILHQYKGNFDSAIYYYDSAKAVFLSEPDRKNAAGSAINIASVYYDQGKFKEALEVLDKTESLLRLPNDAVILAFIDNLRGSIYLYQGFYLLAIKNKDRARDYYKKTGDMIRMADAERDLGLIFIDFGEYEKALEVYRSAGEIYRLDNDKKFLGEVYVSIGTIFTELGALDSAQYYLEEGNRLAMETEFYTLLQKGIAAQGMVLQKLGSTAAAIKKLEESIEMAAEVEDNFEEARTQSNLGALYIDILNYQVAEEYLLTALNTAEDIQAKELVKDIHWQLFRLYNALELTQKALDHHQQYATVKDSLLSDKITQQLAEFETMYELERNRQTLKEQETRITLLRQENKIQNLHKGLLLGALLFLAVLAVFIFFYIRSNHKRSRLKEQLRIQEQQKELELKKRELASFTLHLVQKNQLLEELKEEISKLRSAIGDNQVYRDLHYKFNYNTQLDKDWEVFKKHFEEVHPQFFNRLQDNFPNLSINDLRLLALLKLNLSSKEIASILNITPESVKKSRYRLRKKMNLEDEANISLIINELAG